MTLTRQGEVSKKPQSATALSSMRPAPVSSLAPQHPLDRIGALGNQGVLLRKEAGLRINDVNDPAEREADRVAAVAMRTPEGDTRPPIIAASLAPAVQRQCACGAYTMGDGQCADCAKKKNNLQRKLAIGASNDPLEQEADRVADQVMAGSGHSAVSSVPPRIQRFTGQSTEGIDSAPASVDRVLASSGSPLDSALRQDMEQRFGHDFSQVRVHSGPAAEQSAREVNANAYTVGHNVVFGARRFAPGTQAGRRLIAHELTHVVQQSGNAVAPQPLGISAPGDPAEVAAETVSAQPTRIYRSPTSGTPPTPAAPAPGRTIQIDTNVIVEIGKGNDPVAQALRTLCQTPGVKVQIDRGSYIEAMRVGDNVGPAEVAARKLLIEKLNIKIIDISLEQRAAIYDEFAKDPKGVFTKHGKEGLSKRAMKTFTDLPHIATAIVTNAEIWSNDTLPRENAANLETKERKVHIAPESFLPTVQGVPSNEQNIMRLVPEVKPADLASAIKPASATSPPLSQPGSSPRRVPGIPGPESKGGGDAVVPPPARMQQSTPAQPLALGRVRVTPPVTATPTPPKPAVTPPSVSGTSKPAIPPPSMPKLAADPVPVVSGSTPKAPTPKPASGAVRIKNSLPSTPKPPPRGIASHQGSPAYSSYQSAVMEGAIRGYCELKPGDNIDERFQQDAESLQPKLEEKIYNLSHVDIGELQLEKPRQPVFANITFKTLVKRQESNCDMTTVDHYLNTRIASVKPSHENLSSSTESSFRSFGRTWEVLITKVYSIELEPLSVKELEALTTENNWPLSRVRQYALERGPDAQRLQEINDQLSNSSMNPEVVDSLTEERYRLSHAQSGRQEELEDIRRGEAEVAEIKRRRTEEKEREAEERRKKDKLAAAMAAHKTPPPINVSLLAPPQLPKSIPPVSERADPFNILGRPIQKSYLEQAQDAADYIEALQSQFIHQASLLKTQNQSSEKVKEHRAQVESWVSELHVVFQAWRIKGSPHWPGVKRIEKVNWWVDQPEGRAALLR